jgi:hypothetical protein
MNFKHSKIPALLFVLCAACFSAASAKEPPATGWTQYEGKGYTLCDGLLKALQRYKYPDPLKSTNACSLAVVANYPGITEPPWEDLDVKQNEELLFQLQRFTAIGSKNYFAGIKDKTDYGNNTPEPEDYSRKQVREFIAKGGTLQILRVPVPDEYPFLKNKPETAGPLNILHLRMPVANTDEGLALCPDVPGIAYRGHVALVNHSLTGPDPRQIMSAGAGLAEHINGSALRLFKGVPHLFSGSDFIFVSTLSRSSAFCRLEYRHPNPGRK